MRHHAELWIGNACCLLFRFGFLDGSTWLIAVDLLVYTCDQDGEQVPHLSSWQEPTRQAGTWVGLTMFLEVECHATD